MIGHYLLSLDVESEDAVLTGRFVGGHRRHGPDIDGNLCLVETAVGGSVTATRPAAGYILWRLEENCVPFHYDGLCERFGTARVNAAIRNRILSNRARRALLGVTETRAAVSA